MYLAALSHDRCRQRLICFLAARLKEITAIFLSIIHKGMRSAVQPKPGPLFTYFSAELFSIMDITIVLLSAPVRRLLLLFYEGYGLLISHHPLVKYLAAAPSGVQDVRERAVQPCPCAPCALCCRVRIILIG